MLNRTEITCRVCVIASKDVRPSPEGLLGQLDDIGSGLDVDVVVMQRGRVSGGASLSQ